MFDLNGKRVIDLSQIVGLDISYPPGFPHIEKSYYMSIDRGDIMNIEMVKSVLHIGTHFDAP